MSSPLLNYLTRVLLYAVLVPASFTLALLLSTFVFTNLRYRVRMWQDRNQTGKRRTPVKIPYTIPFLGSALAFLSLKPGSFWNYLLSWHPRETGACTLKVGGRSMHILFDPQAIQALFKAREPTRDSMNYDVAVKGLGLDPAQAKLYYASGEGPSEKLGGRTPKQEQERIWLDTLLRADRVNELVTKFGELLDEELSLELRGDEKSVEEVNLYAWMRKHVFKASTISLLGSSCFSDCDNLEKDYFAFDSEILTCYFGIPKWISPEPYIVRERLLNEMTKWHERNLERNKGKVIDPDGPVAWDPVQGSRSHRARQVYCDVRGLNLRARASLDLGFLFGISSNAIPTTGWMLMHILDPQGDPTLYERVMVEIDACKRTDGNFDYAALMTKPLLLSIMHEVLRLYTDTLVTRELPKDLSLPRGNIPDSILLRKGSIVIAPTLVQHYDTTVYQDPPADTFDADRFVITDPQTSKQTFSTASTAGRLFPFGGGKTICPGRTFAKQEVLGSVALILSRFRFEVLGFVDDKGKDVKEFPKPRDGYPGSATMIMNGDVRVKMRRK